MSTALAKQVDRIVANTPVFDIHTHLYDPAFRELLLWGIDDLLTYHYLVAEAFRAVGSDIDFISVFGQIMHHEITDIFFVFNHQDFFRH